MTISRAYMADAIRTHQQKANIFTVFAGDSHRSMAQRGELMDKHNTELAELAQLRTLYHYVFGYEAVGV